MSKKSKKELAILIVLLGLLSVSIYSQINSPAPSTVLPESITRREKVAASSSSHEVIQVEALRHSVPELSGVKRNIFQFKADMDPGQSAAPGLRLPKIETPVQPPPLPEVHYLGFYFEKDTGLKLASIVNGGKIYVGKVGQTLGGRYELLEIAADHIILRLTDDGKVLRVPLGKGPANVVNWAELSRQGGEH